MPAVCLMCVRQLYTLITFEGPRIMDIDYYIEKAWEEYGIPVSDLMAWSFAEEGQLMDRPGWERAVRTFGVKAPPPHHRFK